MTGLRAGAVSRDTGALVLLQFALVFLAASWRPPARPPRKRTAETSNELTAQEAQIARLARDGLSNPEIGARLFISARTVQHHPGKVFIELGISSRSRLDLVLPTGPATARPH